MALWRDMTDLAASLLRFGIVPYLVPPAVFLALLAGGWIVGRVWKAVGRRLEAAGIGWGQTVVPACLRPLHAFFLITGLYAALSLFPGFEQHTAMVAFFTKIYRSLMIVVAAWVFANLEATPNLRESALAKQIDPKSSKAVLPILSKALRFVTVALAALIIAQEWNFSISGLLAGLGLGGLALSLAAKDMLASLFGGLIILLDKPFKIGDWIEVASVEGTVEDITFRSVKVRTFAEALVTLPNATVVDSAVSNWSRMGKRRVSLTLRLDANTPAEKLRASQKAVLRFMQGYKGVHTGQTTVSFDGVDGVNLLFTVIYYTRTTKWETYLDVRGEVLLNILQVLGKQKVALAAPVQQVKLAEAAGLRSAGEKSLDKPELP